MIQSYWKASGFLLDDNLLPSASTWKDFQCQVTSGSFDFISSCSPRVCGGNTKQHISMGRVKSGKGIDSWGKTWRERWQMRKQNGSYHFSVQNETRPSIPHCSFPVFLQRLLLTDITGAWCIGFDTKLFFFLNAISCNGSFINSRRVCLRSYGFLPGRVCCVCVWGGEFNSYLIIICCLLQNINHKFNKG